MNQMNSDEKKSDTGPEPRTGSATRSPLVWGDTRLTWGDPRIVHGARYLPEDKRDDAQEEI